MKEPAPHLARVGGGCLRRVLTVLAWGLLALNAASAELAPRSRTPDLWYTNGPCVFQGYLRFITNVVPQARMFCPPPTNLPPDLRRAMMQFLVAQQTGLEVQTLTNSVFDHFLPESLNHLVYTNVIARTNGKSMVIWSKRSRPAGWPRQPVEAVWNRHSLVWGLDGFTALSPGWEGEGFPGQVPITALTRRHGYTRGHDMGPEGFRTALAGKRVWFLTKDDQIVERTIVREVVRTIHGGAGDYTIVLFNKHLPDSIQPMRVTHQKNIFAPSRTRYRLIYGAPAPLFMTEQGGQVSAELPGLTVPTRKGGDSGSPNMLPLPIGLVFTSGRATTGPTEAMQADMDELCRLEGLNPRRYQMQWVDLSGFPEY